MGDAREPDSVDGGKGNLLTDPDYFRHDLEIIKRALNEQWEIPPNLLKDVPERLAKILRDKPDMSDREAVRVAQTLDRMVRTNQNAKALAVSQKPEEPSYRPSALHKHEHLHVESAPDVPQIKVELVSDWYGEPDVVPVKNGKKPSKNGKSKKGGKNGKA